MTTSYGSEGMGVDISVDINTVQSHQQEKQQSSSSSSPSLELPFLVANEVNDFVTMVVHLYEDPLFWIQQRIRGMNHLKEAFSETAMSHSIDAMMLAMDSTD